MELFTYYHPKTSEEKIKIISENSGQEIARSDFLALLNDAREYLNFNYPDQLIEIGITNALIFSFIFNCKRKKIYISYTFLDGSRDIEDRLNVTNQFAIGDLRERDIILEKILGKSHKKYIEEESNQHFKFGRNISYYEKGSYSGEEENERSIKSLVSIIRSIDEYKPEDKPISGRNFVFSEKLSSKYSICFLYRKKENQSFYQPAIDFLEDFNLKSRILMVSFLIFLFAFTLLYNSASSDSQLYLQCKDNKILEAKFSSNSVYLRIPDNDGELVELTKEERFGESIKFINTDRRLSFFKDDNTYFLKENNKMLLSNCLSRTSALGKKAEPIGTTLGESAGTPTLGKKTGLLGEKAGLLGP